MFRGTASSSRTKTNNEEKELLSKEANFWQWYLWVLREARIVDTNYSVKGCYIWLDWGFDIFHRIYTLAREAYLESGHQQMQFPTLLKEAVFLKETEFIRNFEDDVFWVDREGHKQLETGERMALRPTSEMIIYPMFARWIRSWRDLPLKIFQNVSVFRCETNETRPLIRNRETIGFIEGHSAFESKEKALTFLEEVGKTYLKLFERLGVPVKLVDVPNWDRFAGSSRTVDGYVLLPNAKSMELFTTAYLGTTFSKIFDIQYLDHKKKKKFAHLLCYGPSIDRILATTISLFGDDRGLILLPEIAPVEVMIVPIFKKTNKEQITTYAREIYSYLLDEGFRIELDEDELTTPGAKFYQSERLGIPIRLEIGVKELGNRSVTLCRRDTLSKITISFEQKDFASIIREKLKEIAFSLKEKVKENFNRRIIDLSNSESFEKAFDQITLKQDQMYLLGWCGTQKCAETIEERTGFTLLGNDLDYFESEQNCIICDKKGKIAVIAKRY